MVYKIIVSPRAQKEIEEAIDYYVLNSTFVAWNCCWFWRLLPASLQAKLK